MAFSERSLLCNPNPGINKNYLIGLLVPPHEQSSSESSEIISLVELNLDAQSQKFNLANWQTLKAE